MKEDNYDMESHGLFRYQITLHERSSQIFEFKKTNYITIKIFFAPQKNIFKRLQLNKNKSIYVYNF